MDPTKVTLKDREGNPHRYEIHPLMPTTAQPLLFAILAAGAGPLTRLIQMWMDIEDDVDSNEEAMAAVMSKLDWSQVSSDLRLSLQGLGQQPELMRKLFMGSFRDQKDLSVDEVYNHAYAGNWAEWYTALYQIIKVNGFFSFAGLSLTTPEKTPAQTTEQ